MNEEKYTPFALAICTVIDLVVAYLCWSSRDQAEGMAFWLLMIFMVCALLGVCKYVTKLYKLSQ